MTDVAHWRGIAIRLLTFTIVYNVLEASVALWQGLMADSIALTGFGLDAVIECAAASVVLWHLSAEFHGRDPGALERIERRVHQFVGATFIVLAVYVTAQSAWVLYTQAPPEESPIGILLAMASLTIMPLVAWGKLRAAAQLNSLTLRAEAKETLACSYLSFTLLLGLSANALLGWWWADPVAALLMVPWLIKEGVEGLRGSGCCHEC